MITIGYNFKANNSAKGALAERKVKEALAKQGFKVTRKRNTGYDLRAINVDTGEIIRIEVKFATQGKDGKYRATTIKRNATDHRKSDYIIFVCQPKFVGGQCVTFIIPCDVQGNKSALCISSNPNTYNGKLSTYKERWDILQ